MSWMRIIGCLALIGGLAVSGARTKAQPPGAPAEIMGKPPAGVVIVDKGPAIQGGAIAADGCCGECFKKCCQPTWEMKKHTEVNYCTKVVEYCLPKCCGFGCAKKKDCCECADGCQEPCHKCGKPRCKRVLVKKFVTEECQHNKCEVVHVPVETCPTCCTPPGCGAPVLTMPAAPTEPKAEPIPAPKDEVKDKQ
ncbi:MAG: hypothetical protein K2R98_17825 [Gemmataceae bacterium]|nr:hypothetical protein [Gemmataceae bacterium]